MSNSIARSTVEDNLDKLIGDYRSFTTTGAGTNSTIVASALSDYPDDWLNEWWVEVTSGTYSGEIRQVSDFVSSTGTLTVRRAFGAALGTGVAFKLHRFNPNLKQYALDDACRLVFPDLYTLKVDENLVSGNILIDGGFEDWTSSSEATFWKGSSGVTITRSSTARYGTYSLQWSNASSNNYLYQSEVENKSLLDLAGSNVNISGWARAVSAGSPKVHFEIVSVDANGVEYTSKGSEITLSSLRWQKIDATSLSICDNASNVSIRFYADSVATILCDNFYLTSVSVYEMRLPSVFTRIPDQVWLSTSNADSVGQALWYKVHNVAPFNDNGVLKLRFNSPLPPGYKMRVVGMEPLTWPSAKTDTIAISAQQAQKLVTLAAHLFFDRLVTESSSNDASRYKDISAKFRSDFAAMNNITMARPATHLEVT